MTDSHRQAIKERDRRIVELEAENRILLAGLQELKARSKASGTSHGSVASGAAAWRIDARRPRFESPEEACLQLGPEALKFVQQISPGHGAYPDRWVEQTVMAPFLSLVPLSLVTAHVWCPETLAPDGIDLQIVINGKTLVREHVEAEKLQEVSAPLTLGADELFSLELRADRAFSLPPPDKRRLSYVLERILFA